MLVFRVNQWLRGEINDVDDMNDDIDNMSDVEIQWKIEMKTYFWVTFNSSPLIY